MNHNIGFQEKNDNYSPQIVIITLAPRSIHFSFRIFFRIGNVVFKPHKTKRFAWGCRMVGALSSAIYRTVSNFTQNWFEKAAFQLMPSLFNFCLTGTLKSIIISKTFETGRLWAQRILSECSLSDQTL
jgi:hypothetical protein